MDKEDIVTNLKGYLYYKKDAKFSFEFSPVKLPFCEFMPEIVEKEFTNFNECITNHFQQFNI